MHGIASGTDSGTTWAIAFYGAAIAAVAGAHRLEGGHRAPPGARPACAPGAGRSESARWRDGPSRPPRRLAGVSAPGARRRWLRPALVGVAVVAVAVAAAFANVALLGSVGEDRIGRLRPVDPTLSSARGATTAPRTVTTTAATPATVAPTTTDDDDDDSSGRGRGRGRSGDSDDD